MGVLIVLVVSILFLRTHLGACMFLSIFILGGLQWLIGFEEVTGNMYWITVAIFYILVKIGDSVEV